jgi:hypothetical protein
MWTLLAESLEPGEVLFHGLRFTDPKEGDVEIDLLLLSPTRGAAIVEVKGGTVKYLDGQWTLTSSGGGKRRIHPIEQARRAKHALRRYLDKSPEWGHGLLRSQWFLAFPMTQVTGSMGPEAPRERVIGRDDMPRARSIIDEGLRTAPREAAVPEGEWVPQATELILHAPDSSQSADRFERAHAIGGHGSSGAIALVGLAIAVLVGSLLAILLAGPWGALIAALVICLAVVLGYRLTRDRSRVPLPLALGVVIGAVVVGGAGGVALRQSEAQTETRMALSPLALETVRSTGIDVNTIGCSTAYSPCVLELPWDRNCDDIGFRITVVGLEDPYGLDRDDNGEGCTSYPESAVGEGLAEQD